MVAEKLETMVRLGMANSRMKDFYDVWLLSRIFEFDGRTLSDAVHNTFKRRSTTLPERLPLAFTEEFRKNAQKQTQWKAFVHKSRPESVASDFAVIVSDVSAFLMPVVEALRGGGVLEKRWREGGPWSGEAAKR